MTSARGPEAAPRLPLPRAGDAGQDPFARTVFATLLVTGPDPAQDELVGIRAWRPGARSQDEAVFECDAHVVPAAAALELAAPRIEAELGIDAARLATGCSAEEVLARFERFAGPDLVLVQESEAHELWTAALGGARERATVLGLVEAAALLLPGRLALRRGELVAALTEGSGGARNVAGPLELQSAWCELARRVLAQEEDVLRVALSGYTRAARGLQASSPRAASRVALLFELFDRPSAWTRGAGGGSLEDDGRISACRAREVPLEDLLEALRPRWTRETERWSRLEPLPSDREEPLPFAEEDRAVLEEVFRVHLPAGFGGGAGSAAPRESQLEVARRIAGTLGAHELLLVHAPTGTGKTLAYLVPALLWARRHDVRIGVATYTRALQEQAQDREVPRALAALARAGVPPGIRVSLLKGRENYLCWRALKLAVPEEDREGEEWLAWTVLALFALSDVEGDLDRLPKSAPLPLCESGPYLQAFSSLARSVRSQSSCCTHRDDRETCAAEAARRRAERSHVVLVNHAFALARQEFFRHVVFDECEHLHDQAHSAWSHALAFRAVRGSLARLAQPSRPGSRAVFDRLAKLVLEESPSHASLGRGLAAWRASTTALAALERAALGFLDWREEHGRDREERDVHALLREYFAQGLGTALLEARCELATELNELESACAEVTERLEALPVRGVASLRRALDLVRNDLIEVHAALEAWLPLDEGRPAFSTSVFYDVERDARGEAVLSARVLLPNEFLGRSYYPRLSSAVFLSATTWLQESFDASRAYLGLDRAAQPAADEDRPPSVVRTFRAPEVFDYSRVLIAVPRDAPPAAGDKSAFLDYVRRFVAHLGERTRGRMLVLFTNAQDAVKVGADIAGFFRARSIGLWYQNMEGSAKEELSEQFRARIDSVLLGVDTFWYGADFPGETLEYLVIVKLPYGVPDRYHHAQCAALGTGEQRRRIYLPRALAKFRQGFGRLMRRESDRGCVFLLDGRVHDPRHRFFVDELPAENPFGPRRDRDDATGRARLVRGDTDHCVEAALEHMGIREDVRRRGLDWRFAPAAAPGVVASATERVRAGLDASAPKPPRAVETPPEVASEDIPF